MIINQYVINLVRKSLQYQIANHKLISDTLEKTELGRYHRKLANSLQSDLSQLSSVTGEYFVTAKALNKFSKTTLEVLYLMNSAGFLSERCDLDITIHPCNPMRVELRSHFVVGGISIDLELTDNHQFNLYDFKRGLTFNNLDLSNVISEVC